MDFNQWRQAYSTMTFQEQIAYHNGLELLYPGQAHFNFDAASQAISIANPKSIIEAGCWKADLAKAILDLNIEIKDWKGIEICTNAIEKSVCKDYRFDYVFINSFDWWVTLPLNADLFIATHFCEHLSDEHFLQLAANFKSKYVYLEIPLSESGEGWEGYHGTHKLTFGWNDVVEIMGKNGYRCTDIAQHCKLFYHG